MEQYKDIGMALRSYRIGARINQEVIARTLGVSQSQVSRWESGRDCPRAHNMEAIRALIWGRRDPVLAGLVYYVREAQTPLVLIDSALRIIAASPLLRMTGGPLAHFGWLFDPRDNPAIAPFAQRYSHLLDTDENLLGVALALPFVHEAQPWACRARLTLYRIGAQAYGMGEMLFQRDDNEAPPHVELRPLGSNEGVERTLRRLHEAAGT